MAERTPTSTRYPASQQQRRVFAQMALAESRAEEISRAYWIEGEIDAATLAAAVRAVADRRDMLRTRLVNLDGTVLQEVYDDGGDIDVVDVPGGRTELDAALHAARVSPLVDRPTWFHAVVFRCRPDGHALLMRLHHGLVDGYSVGLVERDLWTELHSRITGQGTAEHAPTPRYATYRDAGAAEPDAAGEGWWHERLRGATATTVPADRSGTVRQAEVGSVALELTREQTDAIRGLARAQKTTPLAVLLTAHLITVGEFSYETDVLAATAFLNRDDPHAMDLVGPLVNILPVRATIPRPRLRDNLREVTARLREAVQHADVPFDRMQASGLGTGTSAGDGGFGVVRTAIVVQGPGAPGAFECASLKIVALELPSAGLRWDMVISLAESDGRLAGSLLYRADRYSEWIAKSVRDCFIAVLTERENPVPPAPVPSRSGNTLGVDIDRVNRLLSLSAFGDSDPVVVAGEVVVDRTRFLGLVHGYGEALCEFGERPRVALGLGATVDQAAALLAVWRSGGTAVLIDPRWPEGRRSAVLDDARPDGVLTTPLAPVVEPAVEARGGHPEDIAYMIYTSGSSGQPKGVCATYANLEYVLGMLAETEIGLAGFNPMSPAFDGWLWATLMPLVAGRPVSFALRGAADVRGRIGGAPATVTLTPTMLADLDATDVPQAIVSAGEPLPLTTAQRWIGTSRLINAYGPTETSVCVSWSDGALGEDVMSIGRPVANARVHLLDRHWSPVPHGAVGEICVAGTGVTRGYHGLPGRTAQAFVANPHADDGSRLYRTGDLARLDGEGLLYFVGRRDAQTKISGVRVELDEIAAVVVSCDGVVEAAPVVLHTGGMPEVWVGLVIDPAWPGREAELSETVMRVCAERLLPEMRPQGVIPLDRLPTTANGKLDRAALTQAVEHARPRPASGADLDDTCGRVAKVWSEVLDVEVADYDRSFFEYGGHSLLATRAVSRLREEFGMRIPVRVLFDQRTVNGLAAWLDGQGAAR